MSRCLGQAVYTPYNFIYLAGTGYIGTNDGPGWGATFYLPLAGALDTVGNLYVADSGNNTIRKISPSGTVSTLAGRPGVAGSSDGTGSDALFNSPWGVAVDASGNIYVADTGNHTIRQVTPFGDVTTIAGIPGSAGSADGAAGSAQFSSPHGLAIDSDNNIYIADYGNGTVRKLTAGGDVSTIAGSPGQFGSTDGLGGGARFGSCSTYPGSTYCEGPGSIAVHGTGNLYVSDPGNNTIRKIAPDGTVSTLAGVAGQMGAADGIASAARFNRPEGIAIDSAGNLFIVDSDNSTIRRITPSRKVTTLAGAPGTTDNGYSSNGSGSVARFRLPFGLAVDPSGDLYVVDWFDCTVRKGREVASTPYTFTTVAGNAGYGGVDGTGSWARFNEPFGIATDRAGNVYVTDYNNFTIRKITPGGVVTTLAGAAGISGNADGTGNTALFGGCGFNPFYGMSCGGPEGLAVDNGGNIYVADPANEVIRKVTADGVVTTLAGLSFNIYSWQGYSVPYNIGATDGQGNAARFYNPIGVAIDYHGNIIVADTGNSLIRKITPAGLVITLAGMAGSAGSFDGTNSTARFKYPDGVAADSVGNVYVADTGNNTIRKIDHRGVVTTIAGSPGTSGTNDGVGSSARFNAPVGVAVDSSGILYVADSGNNTIRKVTPDGAVTTMAGCAGCGTGAADGMGKAARFNGPSQVAVDGSGNIYVTDSYNNTIRKITPSGMVTTFAGLPPADYSGSPDGVGPKAYFDSPSAVAVDNAGNAYVAEMYGQTIRKVSPGGVTTTLAGLAEMSGSADGTNGAARFNYPQGAAIDAAGNIYVADTDNNTIRKITPDGVVTTVAGSAGNSGSTDAVGSAARFYYPYGIAVDSQTNIYVADTYNNTIRKITPDGNVTTIAGSAGQSGFTDGNGTSARFSDPMGIAVDNDGNLYVTDIDYAIIRKITPGGDVSTIAGCATCPYGSFDGTGADALFYAPWGIAVDAAGNIFVSDYIGFTIRKITQAGVVTTVAGLNGAMGSDDGTGPAVRFGGSYYTFMFGMQYIGPEGMAIDRAGNLYVTDTWNGTLRKGSPPNGSSVFTLSDFGMRGDQFAFSLNGPFGQPVVVEASRDLRTWIPIWTNVFSGPVNFSDPDTLLYSSRFYRAHSP